MGAPKMKWTSEEEAALKAGIQKYGLGKWSTILKDPEFNIVLRARSNVDLKDKWRNLNCMANGLGSRHRGGAAPKNSQSVAKNEEGAKARSSVRVEKDTMVIDAKPVAVPKEKSQNASSRKPIPRVDDALIFEAITQLKEPRGSGRTTIVKYIEEHHSAPPELERAVAARLKFLSENGQLIKVKHQYRIAPRPTCFDVKGKEPPSLLNNGAEKNPLEPEVQINGITRLTKAQIDAELEKMMSMGPQEAAAAAKRAVAEAEAMIALAEAAAREAEEAEAEAEITRSFAEAAFSLIRV